MQLAALRGLRQLLTTAGGRAGAARAGCRCAGAALLPGSSQVAAGRAGARPDGARRLLARAATAPPSRVGRLRYGPARTPGPAQGAGAPSDEAGQEQEDEDEEEEEEDEEEEEGELDADDDDADFGGDDAADDNMDMPSDASSPTLSRTQQKNSARRFRGAAEQIMGLAEKRLATLPLTDVMRDIVRIGQSNHLNKAYREAALLAKMLREHPRGEAIAAAAKAVAAGGGGREDALERIALNWRDGLLAGRPDAEQEVFAFPLAQWGLDRQQLRQRVRSARADAEAALAARAAAAQAAAAGEEGPGSSSASPASPAAASTSGYAVIPGPPLSSPPSPQPQPQQQQPPRKAAVSAAGRALLKDLRALAARAVLEGQLTTG